MINYSNNNPKRKEMEIIRKQKIRGNTELKEKEFNYLLFVIIYLFKRNCSHFEFGLPK